ncbi:MAG: outer membrane protein assembly factor BamC [Burkholderiales bacterium]|nr:outer membrane protein assembly factor BamC [Burkholderiales bacterium]
MTFNRLPRLATILSSAVLLGACSWASNVIKSDKVDYKSPTQSASVPSLEIPPDLTAPARDGRFSVPGDEARRGTVTASELAARGPAQKPQSSGILPRVPDARIERAGNQRWLVVKTAPAELWPQIKEFWQEMGFVIDIERPESGVMETDWAENRAKIGQDFIRRTVGRFLDGLYSTPERDKFRTRLEVNSSGETEIYVSHRGMIEVYRTEGRDQTAWQPRLADPELEVDFLTRLMVRLGSEQTVARRAVETAGSNRPVERAKIVKSGAVQMVEIDESFDRAWRRIGLALDRVGFTVEDRDRSRGVYFVRYADTDATRRRAEPGMLSRFTNWFNQDRVVVAEQYQVKVSDASAVTRVAILSKAGVPEDTQTTQRILNLLHEQLK